MHVPKTTDRKPCHDFEPGAIDILLSNYFSRLFSGLWFVHFSSLIMQPSAKQHSASLGARCLTDT